MLAFLSVAVVGLVGLFLAGLGLAGLFAPGPVRRFLGGFAATAPRHYAELAVRMVVGLALLGAAPHLAGSAVLTALGWVLLATTAVMAVLPWRLHRGFAQRVVPRALGFLPALSVVSLAAGAAALWLAWAATRAA